MRSNTRSVALTLDLLVCTVSMRERLVSAPASACALKLGRAAARLWQLSAAILVEIGSFRIARLCSVGVSVTCRGAASRTAPRRAPIGRNAEARHRRVRRLLRSTTNRLGKRSTVLKQQPLAVLTVSALLFFSSSVSAETSVVSHGSICRPVLGSQAGLASYNQWGVYNTSTTTRLQLICPLPGESTGYYSGGWVTGYDRDPLDHVDVSICTADSVGDSLYCVNNESANPGVGSFALELNPPQTLAYYQLFALVWLPKATGYGVSHVIQILHETP
jgi:hypothetical protein